MSVNSMPAAISRSNPNWATPISKSQSPYLLNPPPHRHTHTPPEPFAFVNICGILLWAPNANAVRRKMRENFQLEAPKSKSNFFPLLSATSTKIVSNSNTTETQACQAKPPDNITFVDLRVLLKWVMLPWVVGFSDGNGT